MVKFFVINLERSIERRTSIIKQLEDLHINYEIINAVDGSLLTKEYIDSINTKKTIKINNGRPLTHGEIGCAESHKKAYEKIIQDKLLGAVIIEDDIVLSSNEILHICDLVSKKIKKKTVVLLGVLPNIQVVPCVWHKIKLNERYSIIKSKTPLRGAWAYYINFEAANSFIKKYPKIISVSDQWERFSKQFRLRLLQPNLLNHEYTHGSEIDNLNNRDYSLEKNNSFFNTKIFKKIRRFYRIYVSQYIP